MQTQQARLGELTAAMRQMALLPKGVAFARIALCVAASRGDVERAAGIASLMQWRTPSPQVDSIIKNWGIVQRAAVNPGTTTDTSFASPLVQFQNSAAEFTDLLRPATIIGKLGMRPAPFNTRFSVQTGGVTVGWVGQGNAAAAASQAYTSLTIDSAKIAAICVITRELAKFAVPNADTLVRDDLLLTCASFEDAQFIDPGVASVTSVSPASITNGITAVQASATPTTLASIEVDFAALFAPMIAANVNMAGLVWVMTPASALAISQLRNASGSYAFPDITANGGTLKGYQVITSNSVPHSVSAGSIIVLLQPQDLYLADAGLIEIDASEHAAVQMNTAPSNSASSLVSLWQSGLLGLRIERTISWRRRRDVSVGILDNFHTV